MLLEVNLETGKDDVKTEWTWVEIVLPCFCLIDITWEERLEYVSSEIENVLRRGRWGRRWLVIIKMESCKILLIMKFVYKYFFLGIQTGMQDD